MATLQVCGTTQDEPGRLSLAMLPYELQVAVFDAAVDTQIIFVGLHSSELFFSKPADVGLALACQLSRARYLKGKKLCRFVRQCFWVDPERDIFYLFEDKLPFSRLALHAERPSVADIRQLVNDSYAHQAIKNVALDLQYLGAHPRFDPVVRVWTLFPSLRTIHILVPKGPLHTPRLSSVSENLVLSPIPSTQIVAAPGHDKELWLAVRYQVKKICTRLLETHNGWDGRYDPEVVGHLTSLRSTGPEVVDAEEIR
jgi:hypothetical protein